MTKSNEVAHDGRLESTVGMAMQWKFAAGPALILGVLAAPLATDAAMVAGVPGSFVYTQPGYFADKPVTVYYYRPKSAGPNAEVLFAMHGADRGGKLSRNHWRAIADLRGFIVVAPEFDQQRFPNEQYQMAGLENRDPAERIPSIIEGLFDKVRGEEGLSAQTYKMFGHSAGAQFGHRLLLQGDKARVSMVVAANAGTYTMPFYPPQHQGGLRYPMVLTQADLPPEALARAFGRRMFVLLGSEDLATDGDHVPKGRAAMAEGANRLERGKRFCAIAEHTAAELHANYNWVCALVPGVSHETGAMVKAASPLLFPPPQ